MDSSLAATPTLVEPKAIKATPHLGCLLLCDLANSTRLIEQLGDSRAAQLIRRHDQLARETLHRFHGQEIDKTDGFLVLFDRPVEAVAFALEYQSLLRGLGEEVGYPLAARVGIHVGEILSWRNSPEDIAQGAKPIEIEGLAKAIAARLMGLAQSGQILLSESAYSLAFRAREELARFDTLRWISHGEYRLHGVSRRMSVFEVGAPDIAPLSAPKSKAKAKRIVPWWHWKPLYALAFGLVAALLAYIFLQPAPAIAFAERDWMVVAKLNNRTGDVRLDDSLDVAIRIGLEQSRHVNLVSSLKTRETLRLMNQPEGGAITRELGAKVAQRVSARVLLLPSIAEVGGRLRFTAELVDPRTETTVYSHSGEAGSESDVLPVIDDVLRQVRTDLGESMRSVEASSLQLAQITTANMDALRAYSLGKMAMGESRLEDAELLYRQALELDPDCHSAILGLAAIALTRDQTDSALQLLHQIDTARVPPRDKFYVDAMRAWIEDSLDTAVRRWRVYSEMYPDELRAAANYGHALYDAQRYDDSLQAHRSTLTEQNPLLSSSYSSAAASALAMSDFNQANELQQLALSNGNSGRYNNFFLLPLAGGDITRASETLQRWQAQPFSSSKRRVVQGQVMLALDLGQWRDAVERLRSAELDDAEISDARDWELLRWVVTAMTLGGEQLDSAAARAYFEHGLAQLGAGPTKLRVAAAIETLSLGVAAARSGNLALAEQALAGAQSDSAAQQHPAVQQWTAGLNAEIQALKAQPVTLPGSAGQNVDYPAFQSQASRLRVASLQGDVDAARSSAEWMRRHRGGAVSESGSSISQVALNFMELASADVLVALASGEAPVDPNSIAGQRWQRALNGEFGPSLAQRVAALSSAD